MDTKSKQVLDLNYFLNKKILITGGNGFIAYHLVRMLNNIQLDITRLDTKIDNWHKLFNDSKIKFNDIEDNIQNRKILEELLPGHDIIIHLAAQTSVYVADSDPAEDVKNNLLPLVNILDICEKQALNPVILFSGTATEVGLNETLKVDEQSDSLPVTIYDLNKFLAEAYLNYYCRKRIVRGATLRLANVYGPGPERRQPGRGIVNLMIKKALNGSPITVYGDGRYIRDYIFIDDVAEAFLCAVQKIDKINGNFYYIGSGQGHTVAQAFAVIGNVVGSFTGKDPVIEYIEPPADLSLIETRQFIADCKRFIEATGWKPRTDFLEGISLTVKYYLVDP